MARPLWQRVAGGLVTVVFVVMFLESMWFEWVYIPQESGDDPESTGLVKDEEIYSAIHNHGHRDPGIAIGSPLHDALQGHVKAPPEATRDLSRMFSGAPSASGSGKGDSNSQDTVPVQPATTEAPAPLNRACRPSPGSDNDRDETETMCRVCTEATEDSMSRGGFNVSAACVCGPGVTTYRARRPTTFRIYDRSHSHFYQALAISQTLSVRLNGTDGQGRGVFTSARITVVPPLAAAKEGEEQGAIQYFLVTYMVDEEIPYTISIYYFDGQDPPSHKEPVPLLIPALSVVPVVSTPCPQPTTRPAPLARSDRTCRRKEVIDAVNNGGRWIEDTFHPYDCQLRHFTRQQARQCMAKTTLLLIGDSTVREAVNGLMAILWEDSDFAAFKKEDVDTARCDLAVDRGVPCGPITLYNHGRIRYLTLQRHLDVPNITASIQQEAERTTGYNGTLFVFGGYLLHPFIYLVPPGRLPRTSDEDTAYRQASTAVFQEMGQRYRHLARGLRLLPGQPLPFTWLTTNYQDPLRKLYHPESREWVSQTGYMIRALDRLSQDIMSESGIQTLDWSVLSRTASARPDATPDGVHVSPFIQREKGTVLLNILCPEEQDIR